MIRVATLDDAAAFAAIYAPFVEGSHTSFEETAPTVEEMAGRIERTLRTHPWLCEDEAGFAYATPHRERRGYRWAVDVSVYVGDGHRGKGLGRRLYRALFEILRAQGYVVVYAGIALPNGASVGLHEAMGFRQVALYEGVGFKAGAWHDVGWWALDLAPRETPPREPVPFEVVRSSGR